MAIDLKRVRFCFVEHEDLVVVDDHRLSPSVLARWLYAGGRTCIALIPECPPLAKKDVPAQAGRVEATSRRTTRVRRRAVALSTVSRAKGAAASSRRRSSEASESLGSVSMGRRRSQRMLANECGVRAVRWERRALRNVTVARDARSSFPSESGAGL